MSAAHNVTVAVRLTVEQHTRMKEASRRTRLPMTEIIRLALADYLSKVTNCADLAKDFCESEKKGERHGGD